MVVFFAVKTVQIKADGRHRRHPVKNHREETGEVGREREVRRREMGGEEEAEERWPRTTRSVGQEVGAGGRLRSKASGGFLLLSAAAMLCCSCSLNWRWWKSDRASL